MTNNITDPRIITLGDEKPCADCKQPFSLTHGEQEFYTQKLLDDPQFNAPKRCKECLAKKKARNRAREEGQAGIGIHVGIS